MGDLRADDFVLREDGREQEILIFAPAARPEEREELTLNLGMLFDTSESMRKDLRLSQESAIRFLDAIPRARDLLLIFFDRDIRISRYSVGEPAGDLRAHPRDAGRRVHRPPRRDRRLPLAGRPTPPAARCSWCSPTATTRRAARARRRCCACCAPARSVTVYPVEFVGERRPGTTEALRAHAFLAGLAESDRRPRLPAARVEGARRHLPVDPRRAGQPVRHRLRLRQPRARRQVPEDHARGEAART